MRGRKKAIWVSVSSMLYFDAKRDLDDITNSEIAVHNLTEVGIIVIEIDEIDGLTLSPSEILFSNYRELFLRNLFLKKLD